LKLPCEEDKSRQCVTGSFAREDLHRVHPAFDLIVDAIEYISFPAAYVFLFGVPKKSDKLQKTSKRSDSRKNLIFPPHLKLLEKY
jgi:hypothetical protein